MKGMLRNVHSLAKPPEGAWPKCHTVTRHIVSLSYRLMSCPPCLDPYLARALHAWRKIFPGVRSADAAPENESRWAPVVRGALVSPNEDWRQMVRSCGLRTEQVLYCVQEHGATDGALPDALLRQLHDAVGQGFSLGAKTARLCAPGSALAEGDALWRIQLGDSEGARDKKGRVQPGNSFWTVAQERFD